MSAVFSAAMREWRRSAAKGLLQNMSGRAGLQDRIERVMNVTLSREMERTEKYMTFLESVGATAPYIGLLGTVWGIMNSCQSTAVHQQPPLAVFHPGIPPP